MSSEQQTRPAAARGGRGASRGGRGGFGSRGSTRTRDRPAGAANGDAHAKHDDSLAGLEDEGEIGQLKRLYGAKTSLIKEMFPDWSDVDILFALRETDGDENLTVTRIAEGTISQWDEVSKPKKERTKPKPAAAGETAPAAAARPARNGAAPERTRGRARAPERGGRAARGRSAQPTNGTRPEKSQLSVPTEESPAWDSNHNDDDTPATNTTPATSPNETTPAPAPPAKAADSAAPPPKTWASMLRQATVPKPAPKPKEAPPVPKPVPEPADPAPAPAVAPEPEVAEPEPAVEEPAQPAPPPEVAVPEVAVPAVAVPEVALPPSKDQLTESNLERVTDISNPPPTETIRSEAADSWDPHSAALAGAGTPISASQQQHQSAAAPKSLGRGYATSALKATDRAAVRTPSYSRRVLDQEEAVRMPGNRDVDRAAVQFGALNFSGADDDIDGDREEPETRAQPPDDSPLAHPRASLPPVAPPATAPDALSVQKPAAAPVAAPALPPTAPAAAATTAPIQPASAAAALAQPAPASQPYGRFGQPLAQDSTFSQKPFDAYGQPSQPVANSQFDSFQHPTTSSLPPAQAPAAYSSAPGDYAQQYYSADAQSRGPYAYYGQAYGQQAAQGHDSLQNQRTYSGYPLNESLNQYPQSNASRFGAAAAAAAPGAVDAQNSGNTTPNPPAPGHPPAQQQQPGAAQNGQAQTQTQQQPGQYSYNHPYYASPYYAHYVNQYGFGQGNFGPYGGKGGYGNHHPGYGQTPYDHNVSQASGFGAASSLHRGADANALATTGLGDYSRVGAGQPSTYGSGHDANFGRAGAAAYQTQSGQGFGASQSQAAGQQAGPDDLKPFGESKTGAGPSPSMGGARPGSATNTQSSQPGLPPPQSSQQGIGSYSYPSHHAGLHGNQSAAAAAAGYGMGAGANQSHTANPYGGYGGHGGQGFGGNSYYGNQQQRGWGNNYH